MKQKAFQRTEHVSFYVLKCKLSEKNHFTEAKTKKALFNLTAVLNFLFNFCFPKNFHI